MLGRLLRSIRWRAEAGLRSTRRRLAAWTRPATSPALVLGAAADLVRSRSELIAENALLRQQLIVLARTEKRPRLTRSDRALLVLLASRVRAWRQALLIVRPGHAAALASGRVSRSSGAGSRRRVRRQPRVPPDTVALIRQMARENRLWGAERIRGELRKLGIPVCKRTIQKYMRQARPPRPPGQTWATFLRTHAREIWACDFLQLTDLLFRPLFAFFVVELGSRRVVHVGVTRSPTDAWAAQQLREATPDGQAPRFLIRDNDGKFGPDFARVAAASGIEVLRTPPLGRRAPTPSASASWAASGGSAWTTSCSSASGTSGASWSSTSVLQPRPAAPGPRPTRAALADPGRGIAADRRPGCRRPRPGRAAPRVPPSRLTCGRCTPRRSTDGTSSHDTPPSAARTRARGFGSGRGPGRTCRPSPWP